MDSKTMELRKIYMEESICHISAQIMDALALSSELKALATQSEMRLIQALRDLEDFYISMRDAAE